jgi:enoyl-CoA hydratase/carnithine racemase
MNMTENEGTDTVLYDCAERIATITFNRPNKLNVL